MRVFSLAADNFPKGYAMLVRARKLPLPFLLEYARGSVNKGQRELPEHAVREWIAMNDWVKLGEPPPNYTGWVKAPDMVFELRINGAKWKEATFPGSDEPMPEEVVLLEAPKW